MSNLNPIKKAERARELGWDGSFPVDPRKISKGIVIVKKFGGEKIRMPILMEGEFLDELSGYAEFVGEEGGERYRCVYNLNENHYRQRFTQAHELGHIMLKHVTEKRPKLRDVTFNAYSHDREEVGANLFAAELLMPEKYVEHLSRKSSNVQYIADYFGVSPTAMHYRLVNLDLI